MTEFLLQILRVTQEAPTPQSTQPSPDTMQRVMAYINEHYAQPLTLEEIFIYELGGADYAVRDIVL